MKNKIFPDAAAAMHDITDGATVMLHTFGGPGGIAQYLIRSLRDRGTKNLTIITCSMGVNVGLVRGTPGLREYVTPMILVENNQVKKVISSYPIRSIAGGAERKEATPLEKAIAAGEVECEVVPQGILAERIRAGAAGLGGILSPIGIGTLIERGKEKKVINGKEYLIELPLRADFALVKAYQADTWGNLTYRGTSKSFNPLIAMAASVTIVEAEHIINPEAMITEQINTSGVFVDRIVQSVK